MAINLLILTGMGIFAGRILRLACLPLVAAAGRAASQPIVDVDMIVERMLQAKQLQHAQLRPYSVKRTYKLFGRDRATPKSEIMTGVDYVPPVGQSYRVTTVQGLHLGETLVRRILDNEKAVLANRGASAISRDNYSFHLLRVDTLDGIQCYLVEIQPRRTETNLLRGTVWIAVNDYLLRRVEGEPAKSPSWWIRNVHVTLDFNEVHGMWLQTALRSTARVRMLGQYSIVSQDTEYAVESPDSVQTFERNPTIETR